MRFFNRKSGFLALCCCALAFLSFLPASYAQQLSGMTGVVTDQSGAALPGVVITLENKTTGLKYTQTTNELGFYRFAEIPPGQGYSATFSGKGFAQFEVSDIYLTVATVRTQNATLAVNARQEV